LKYKIESIACDVHGEVRDVHARDEYDFLITQQKSLDGEELGRT